MIGTAVGCISTAAMSDPVADPSGTSGTSGTGQATGQTGTVAAKALDEEEGQFESVGIPELEEEYPDRVRKTTEELPTLPVFIVTGKPRIEEVPLRSTSESSEEKARNKNFEDPANIIEFGDRADRNLIRFTKSSTTSTTSTTTTTTRRRTTKKTATRRTTTSTTTKPTTTTTRKRIRLCTIPYTLYSIPYTVTVIDGSLILPIPLNPLLVSSGSPRSGGAEGYEA